MNPVAHPPRPSDCALRVAVWGDLHCEDAVSSWYPDKLIAAQDASAALAPDIVIQLGDIMGGHDTAHLWTPSERRVYLPILRRFSENAPAVMLQGNHDGEADWHAALSATYPILVATDPGPVRVVAGGRPVYVWCLPFPHRGHLAAGRTFVSVEVETAVLERELQAMLEDWRDAIAEIREDEPDSIHIVATHASWKGAVPGGGEVYQPGGDITVDPGGLVATGADLVVGGHVHGPQMLGPRCLLTGATRHLGFGEGGESRYHWMVDICERTRPADMNADGECLQFIFGDARGSITATGLPTGTPRRITIEAEWNGERFVHAPVPARAEGAQVRIVLTADETHEGTLPTGEAARAAILGDVSTFGVQVDRPRIQRSERAARAPEMLTADRDDPVAMLACWHDATKGTVMDREQQRRIRRNIEQADRDPVADLRREFGDLIPL